jgi:hypothetical protein
MDFFYSLNYFFEKVKNVRESAIMTLNLIRNLKGRSQKPVTDTAKSAREKGSVERKAAKSSSISNQQFQMARPRQESSTRPGLGEKSRAKSPENSSENNQTINSKRNLKEEKMSILKQPINPGFLKNAVSVKGDVLIKTSAPSFRQNSFKDAYPDKENQLEGSKSIGEGSIALATTMDEKQNQRRNFSKNFSSSITIQNFIEENHIKINKQGKLDMWSPDSRSISKVPFDETPVRHPNENTKGKEFPSPLKESLTNMETLYHEIERDVKALNKDSPNDLEGIHTRMTAIMTVNKIIIYCVNKNK